MNDRKERQRAKLLSAHRTPASPLAAGLIKVVLADLEGHAEASEKPRQRARRPADQRQYEERVSAIICDLIVCHLSDPDAVRRVSLSSSGSGPYKTIFSGKTLCELLLALAETDWLILTIGDQQASQYLRAMTTVAPGPSLISAARRLELSDFAEQRGGQTIFLKSGKADYWDTSRLLKYADTLTLAQMRRDMEGINAWLRQADLSLDETEFDALLDEFGFDPDTVDLNNRFMRRIFNSGKFDHGGRLFGGFWQGMKSDIRKRAILINGDPVAALDYRNMTARMVYGDAGVEPTSPDLYTIPGFNREMVKKVVSAALFQDAREGKKKQYPTGIPKWQKGKHKIEDVWRAIQTHHPILYAQFFKQAGLGLMFKESNIMIDILQHTQSLGIVALPIHDAVVVPVSAKDIVRTIMVETFRSHIGIPGLVHGD